MTLREGLKSIPDDRTIYIGARNSYFFGGTKAQFMKDVDSYDGMFRARARRSIMLAKAKIDDSATGKRIMKKVSDNAKKRYAATLEYYKAYKPILDREIKDIFERVSTDAVDIIIEGDEEGSMWLRSDEEQKPVNVTFTDDLVTAIIHSAAVEYAYACKMGDSWCEDHIALSKQTLRNFFTGAWFHSLAPNTSGRQLAKMIEADPDAVLRREEENV